MTYVFAPPDPPVVPVKGTEALFPVNRIYCVGQNYSDHVKEMGGDPKSSPPVFFSKPASAIVTDNKPVTYPTMTRDLHHEVELVVALQDGGEELSSEAAVKAIFGYAVGVDFTRRDLQAQAKKNGKPWDVAKGFDQSAPLSAITPVQDGKQPQSGAIWLEVNGERRQSADLGDMIWSVPEILVELSRFFELRPGDLVFTGTPAGVSAVQAGDHLKAGVEGVAELEFDLVSR